MHLPRCSNLNSVTRKKLKEPKEELKFHQEARTYPDNQGCHSEIPMSYLPSGFQTSQYHLCMGTGKTTIACWLHQRGLRAVQRFVGVNRSAMPESLTESELFGHERGAFTDARTTN